MRCEGANVLTPAVVFSRASARNLFILEQGSCARRTILLCYARAASARPCRGAYVCECVACLISDERSLEGWEGGTAKERARAYAWAFLSKYLESAEYTAGLSFLQARANTRGLRVSQNLFSRNIPTVQTSKPHRATLLSFFILYSCYIFPLHQVSLVLLFFVHAVNLCYLLLFYGTFFIVFHIQILIHIR